MLLTINSQIQALCEEGFSLPRLCLLAWIGRVLGHQFEDMEKEFVKGAASLKVLGIIGTQLQKLLRQVNILKNTLIKSHSHHRTNMACSYSVIQLNLKFHLVTHMRR